MGNKQGMLEVGIEEIKTRQKSKLFQSHNLLCYTRERVQREEKELLQHQQHSLYIQFVCCCTVACARVVQCVRAYAKVCLLYRVTRHVASTYGRSMTNGANYKKASYIIVLGIVISVLPISSTLCSPLLQHRITLDDVFHTPNACLE